MEQPVPPSLPDDLIAEILARVPYKSLCRFKCVSRPWLALCSDPVVRCRCPQTMSGFFFNSLRSDGSYGSHLVNLSGRGPPMVNPTLSFLPAAHRCGIIYDCCNGLLLCRRRNAHSRVYFVCNPATEEWMDLPDTGSMKASSDPIIRLGFDPAVSSHFSVFLLVHTGTNVLWPKRVTGVEIYSSETGSWTHRLSGWGDDTTVFGAGSASAFFNSTLYLASFDSSVITVDRDGRIWRKITTPRLWQLDLIGQFRKRLCAVHIDQNHQLSIWVLEDYGGQKWVLKHIARAPEIREIIMVQAIHPENNLIYLTVGQERNLISYDMDTRKVNAIQTLGARSLARLHPYVPYLSECLDMA
jgi:F-box interacting protein